MMLTLLLSGLFCAVMIVIALLVVVLRRRPEALLDAHRLALEQVLRAEQRDGRGELRQQLDSLSLQQEQRIDGFGARLEQLRETLNDDARKVLRGAHGFLSGAAGSASANVSSVRPRRRARPRVTRHTCTLFRP